MTEATGWPPSEPDETQSAQPEPDEAEAGAEPWDEPKQPPDPDWLTEVKTNAPGILGTGIVKLYELFTAGR